MNLIFPYSYLHKLRAHNHLTHTANMVCKRSQYCHCVSMVRQLGLYVGNVSSKRSEQLIASVLWQAVIKLYQERIREGAFNSRIIACTIGA